jgi:hypothetical protein
MHFGVKVEHLVLDIVRPAHITHCRAFVRLAMMTMIPVIAVATRTRANPSSGISARCRLLVQ